MIWIFCSHSQNVVYEGLLSFISLISQAFQNTSFSHFHKLLLWILIIEFKSLTCYNSWRIKINSPSFQHQKHREGRAPGSRGHLEFLAYTREPEHLGTSLPFLHICLKETVCCLLMVNSLLGKVQMYWSYLPPEACEQETLMSVTMLFFHFNPFPLPFHLTANVTINCSLILELCVLCPKSFG